MRLQVVQHVPFEDAGSIASWALGKGHDATAMLAGTAPFPSPDDYDMLVVMGGPMGVHDVERHPWLEDEKRAIGEAIEAGRVVLGVCLGAQLVAAVLGAPVVRAEKREVGWYPVRLTDEARSLPLFKGAPRSFKAFHWHEDTFGIPEGATRIGESAACRNQGFLYGDRVLGLQFHLEVDAETVERFIDEYGAEPDGEGAVQRPVLLRAGAVDDNGHQLLWGLLDKLEETGVA